MVVMTTSSLYKIEMEQTVSIFLIFCQGQDLDHN